MDCCIAAAAITTTTTTTPTIDHRTDNTGDVHWQCIDTGRVKITISKCRDNAIVRYTNTRRRVRRGDFRRCDKLYEKKGRRGGQCVTAVEFAELQRKSQRARLVPLDFVADAIFSLLARHECEGRRAELVSELPRRTRSPA